MNIRAIIEKKNAYIFTLATDRKLSLVMHMLLEFIDLT